MKFNNKSTAGFAAIEITAVLHYNFSRPERCRGEVMKKNIFLLSFLAAAMILAAGKTLVVKVLRSQLSAKPDFLSGSLATIQRGSRLELLESKGNWYLVKNANGAKGYVHQSAVTASASGLGGAVPYKKGASDEELALAAKGFNEGNENKLRGSRGYDFGAVDWVLEQEVTHAVVAGFVTEGKLK